MSLNNIFKQTYGIYNFVDIAVLLYLKFELIQLIQLNFRKKKNAFASQVVQNEFSEFIPR